MAAAIHAKLLSSSHTFTLAEAKSYVEAIVNAQAMDEDMRFKKRLLEEFWPLVAIAQCIGDEHTRIIYQGSSKDVDAQLLIHNLPPQPIEFTIAFDAEQEALRDEHLEKYGYAPVTAILDRPSQSRASGKREIAEVGADFWGRDERQDIQFGWMKKALERKQKLAMTRDEYRNAWLCVVVDNNRPKEWKQKFFDLIGVRLLSNVGSYTPFSRVFIVSTVGDYVFDSATMSSRLLSTP